MTRLSKIIFLALGLSLSALAQEPIEPPSLGQNTQGKPAVLNEEENVSNSEALNETIDPSTITNELEAEDQSESSRSPLRLLGTTKINELRRENGRIYRIEFEHSSGSKQVIEEFDSDGKIESKSNDIEETPNLPKWRLGSW